MDMLHCPRGIGVVIGVLIATMIVCADARAQWVGPDINSILPIKSLEPYIIQVLPNVKWGNSFRSEWGLRFSVAEVSTARLSGSKAGFWDESVNPKKWEGGMVDLSPDLDQDEGTQVYREPYLNNMPIRMDAYVTLRVWRVGIRANYAEFTNRANLGTRGYLDFGGFSVGGDFDVVQREWLTVGLCADAYFKDPVFKGYVPYNGYDTHYNPDTWPDFFDGEVRGHAPITVGYYARYVPPEIIGMPVHFESFLNYPVKGAYYATIGAALVFRPQIYRFDIMARLKFARMNLGFDEDTKSKDNVGPPINQELQNWKVEASWNVYGVEFGMYF